MSPLKISILLHYYALATDFRDGDFTAPAVREAIDWLRDEVGMLAAIKGADTAYSLTDKGFFFVEYLCSVPVPTTKFVIEMEDKQ